MKRNGEQVSCQSNCQLHTRIPAITNGYRRTPKIDPSGAKAPGKPFGALWQRPCAGAFGAGVIQYLSISLSRGLARTTRQSRFHQKVLCKL